MQQIRLPVIFLMGPTAAGKTDIAVRLCNDLPCDIISVDSAMVYRDMNIGTSKPDLETLERAPHRLINICDPKEPYSAAQFRSDAMREIDDILSKNRIPLLVGGTFLYFRALEKGLSPLPSANGNIRAQLESEAKLVGWHMLHDRLRRIDPEAAARIHPNDPQRIQRALEIYTITGQAMSDIIRSAGTVKFPYKHIKIIVSPSERTVLHERIEKRFLQMLESGLLAEVGALYHREDLHKDLPSMRSVGYRQLWEHLDGETSYLEMQNKGIFATRQLAKRQLTWLRSESETIWFDSLSSQIYTQVLKYLNQGLISKH